MLKAVPQKLHEKGVDITVSLSFLGDNVKTETPQTEHIWKQWTGVPVLAEGSRGSAAG